jgi:hypothetical protein
MTDRPDPRLAIVERRLERRLERLPAAAPAASLRRRVLTAVDDVLMHEPMKTEKVPATKSGGFGTPSFPFFPDSVAGTRFPNLFPWAWVAAVAAGVAVVAACLASAAPVPRGPRITLSERLRIAGVADEGLRESLIAAFAAAPRPAVATATATSFAGPAVGPAARAAFTVIDARRLLEENP